MKTKSQLIKTAAKKKGFEVIEAKVKKVKTADLMGVPSWQGDGLLFDEINESNTWQGYFNHKEGEEND